MFEQASRLKLRFNHKGLLSVEDLWDLSVQELDAIFKELNRHNKERQEESLLKERSRKDKVLSLKIDVVKHIVKVKLEEEKQRKLDAANRLEKVKILGVIEQKEDEALRELSVKELKKRAKELS